MCLNEQPQLQLREISPKEEIGYISFMKIKDSIQAKLIDFTSLCKLYNVKIFMLLVLLQQTNLMKIPAI